MPAPFDRTGGPHRPSMLRLILCLPRLERGGRVGEASLTYLFLRRENYTRTGAVMEWREVSEFA
jgi:hypothetical protein